MITVNPAGDHWSSTRADGSTWSGGGDDGKLYAVTLVDIPDNPSLPGLTDLDLIVADIIASLDGAARAAAGARRRRERAAVRPGQRRTPGAPRMSSRRPRARDTLHQPSRACTTGTYSQLVARHGLRRRRQRRRHGCRA